MIFFYMVLYVAFAALIKGIVIEQELFDDGIGSSVVGMIWPITFPIIVIWGSLICITAITMYVFKPLVDFFNNLKW